MFELFLIFSRYIFVFIIGIFIVSTGLYIGSERNYIDYDKESIEKHQIYIMLIMNFLAFFIFSFEKETSTFNMEVLLFSLGIIAFFFITKLITNLFYNGSDKILWNCIFFIMNVSLIFLYRLNPEYSKKQLLWYILGIGLSLSIPLILRIIQRPSRLEFVYLILNIALLVLPFMFGKKIYGANNWVSFTIGDNKFGFQPSEIAKFFYIFYLASAFSKYNKFEDLILPSIVAFISCMILVLQRDLGGALIFFLSYLILVYVSTGNVLYFLLGIMAVSVAAYGAYLMFDHVAVRVEIWQDPWNEPNGIGFQILQSYFAIGAGGLFGTGLTLGQPYRIPVVESDFIFSGIAEEFGAIFALGIIIIYLLIIYRGVHISLRCKDKDFCFISLGFISMVALQTFLILGGVIKLIPLTGVTLPLLSYGGTSALVSVIMVGVLQWIYKNDYDTGIEKRGKKVR